MMQKWRKFKSEHEGAVLIEFAMVAPILFATIFAIIEFGVIMLASTTIESATNQTARLARTRNLEGANAGTSLEQHLRNEIQRRSGGLVDANRVLITTDLRGYGAIRKPDVCLSGEAVEGGPCPPDAGGTVDFIEVNGQPGFQNTSPPLDLGAEGDLIQLQVHYPYQVILPGIQALLGSGSSTIGDQNGVFMITSSTLIKNEP